MTTPDTVGGLPAKWREAAEHGGFNSQQAHILRLCAAELELCRAAPAGGDVVKECENCMGHGVELDREKPCNYCNGTGTERKDSAPAGSGEVDALERNLVDAMNQIHRLDQARQRWIERAVKMRRAYKEQRDLLRKLQQGADGWRPIESAPEHGSFLVHRDGHVMAAYRTGGEIMHEALHEPFIAMPTHWQPYPAPASQDQDGGKA